MRRILFSLVIALSFIFSYGQDGRIGLNSKGARQECTNDSFYSFDAVFSFEGIESSQISTEKGTFSAITMAQTFPTGTYGTPQLPSARKLIAVPQGATPRIIIKNYDQTEYRLEDFDIKTIYPNQPSVRKDMKPEDVKFVYKESAYATKGYEERPIAQVEVLGNLRALRIGALTINPVIYNASTNSIIVRNNIEVEVVFDGADKAATQDLYESTYSIYFKNVYEMMFNRDVYDDHPDLFKVPTYMLVIAPDSYEQSLQPWIEWKTKKGIYVDVHYTSETGTTYNAIKSFVYNKYNTGLAQGKTPTFLVLVGDTPQVPNTTGNETSRVTDLYYSSVDNDDFPDMYCSRMCCSTTAELDNLIEKILCYEQVTTDPSYLGKALLIAGADANWNPKVGQPTVNYGLQNHFNADHNYTNVYSYLSSYTGCYDNLNTGVGFVNYTAHGGETGWSSPSFETTDANALTNVGKYFLAIGNCCLAADFGYSSVCLGEAMIRGHQKGAYTYIGSCPSTYWYEDYYWSVGATSVFNQTPTFEQTATGVYDILNWDTSFNTTNSIFVLGNIAVCYAHDYSYQTSESTTYYWQSYHCLGDGSIMPYCGLPTDNDVSHMAIVPIGLNYYEVSAAPGSIVAISKDGVLHGTAVVDASGVVQVPLEPILNGGDVDIVVTCHNKYPYMVSIPAAALEGPYIVANGYEIDGDGVLSYGEQSGLSLTIKNVGTDPTSGNTMVTLLSDSELISIINGSVEYGEMASDETITMGGFVLAVSPDVEDGQQFVINVVATNNDDTWQSKITVQVHKPILEFGTLSWDGMYTPGQTLELTLSVQNTGSFIIHDVLGTISTDNEYVTINTPTMEFGNIEAGAYTSAIFSITISEDCPETQIINFNFNFSGDDDAINGNAEFLISNSCNLLLHLIDGYGDGWNGASLVLSFSDGTPDQTFTISGGNSADYSLEVNSGTAVTLTWTPGSYDSECSLMVYYEETEVLIYQTIAPVSGELTTFIMDCGVTCNGVSGFTVVAGGNGTMNLSWTAPQGDIDTYNVIRDGELIASVNETEFVDTDLEDGDYVYCVEPVYSDGCIGITSCKSAFCGDFFYMPISGTMEIVSCNGVLYDDGGENSNYSNNCNGITIIKPSTPGAMIHIEGTFEVEKNYDKLYIYDGEGINGTLLGTFTNPNTGTIDLTSTVGALTVHFTSDGSVTKSGFILSFSCEGGVISDILGDANNDMEVNISDITCVISYMFSNEVDPFIFDNADVYPDGVINVLDIQGIINIILGDKYDECSENLDAADYYIQNGILYINTPIAISALQISISLPEYNSVKPMASLDGFTQYSDYIDKSSYMFVAYSMDYSNIGVGNNAILNVGDDAIVTSVILSDIAGCPIEAKSITGFNEVGSVDINSYPNPFSESINISFNMNEINSTELVITNINGSIIDRVIINDAVIGNNIVTWTPSDAIESGMYFITMKVNGIYKQTMKVVYNK